MKKRNCRRRICSLLLAALLALTGCGAAKESRTPRSEGADVQADGQSTETGMGRYLEKEVALPEEVSQGSTLPRAYLTRLSGGELLLMDQASGMYVSSDRGETWTHRDTPWYDGLDGYIAQIALAPDGSAAVIYSPYEKEGEETGEVYEYDPEYLYADPEGNTKRLEEPDPEDCFNQLWFGKDNRLYAYSLGGKAYELDAEKGTSRLLFEIEGVSEYVCFAGPYMITFTSRDEAVLYDLEKGEMAADEVLQDFVRDQVGSSFGADDSYHVVAAAGEQDDVLYLAYSGGLYRHAVGGSVMEQLSDGSITSLGDPMMGLCGFAVLPDNEFFVLYDQARLYRYVYDPDLPSVPEDQIHIYSLTDDYTIRQAVSLYQKQHPEAYVRYEVGLARPDGRTPEDAVRNLNTKILSGSGPDLLVLDGLPYDSYVEKGLLTDLSRIVHDMEQEAPLWKNLVDACRKDGRLYALPVRFRLPLLVGDPEEIGNVQDLNSLADLVEGLRREHPKGALIGLKTEEEVLRTLGLTSSGAWIDPETGTLSKEKLTEYLECARRIYEAETAGLDAEELAAYRKDHHESWQSDVTGEGMYYAVASANALDVAMEAQKLGAGITYRMDCEFNMITTLADQEEAFGYVPWKGQVDRGFLPQCMVGICAGAEEKEPAVDFFRFLYGSGLQDLEFPAGYPINMASFERLRENPREEYGNAGIVLVSEESEMFALDVQWCPEEEFARLKEMVQSANAFCTGDARIEQIVYELGEKAVNGQAGVEKTVEEIMQKAAIYLAE